jgi:hypothetical protein
MGLPCPAHTSTRFRGKGFGFGASDSPFTILILVTKYCPSFRSFGQCVQHPQPTGHTINKEGVGQVRVEGHIWHWEGG